MTKSEILNELFKKYELIYDPSNPDSKENDVYAHKHYKIITRSGIQKIERKAGIKCLFRPVYSACGKDYFTLHGHGTLGEAKYETFASASELTSQNKYFPEMAEKRCRSRIVLTLAGLYELGVFGEDESDQFSKDTQESQGIYIKKLYKGSAAS
jgi:hypothetical protein